MIKRGAKLLLTLLLLQTITACGDQEPQVPSATRSAGDDNIIRFPVRDDGSIDTSVVAKMSFQKPEYNFGAVDAGAVVQHRFAFKNVGARPLTITQAKSTCGCTVPVYPKGAIAVGDTASILVKFDTQGKSGDQNKAITLTANTYPNTTVINMVGTVDN